MYNLFKVEVLHDIKKNHKVGKIKVDITDSHTRGEEELAA